MGNQPIICIIRLKSVAGRGDGFQALGLKIAEKMKKKITGMAVILLAILAAGLFYYRSGQVVEVVKMSKGTISEDIEETGYVQTADDYDIQAPSGGRIVQLNVSKGQAVRAGQIIMTLQNLDLEAQLAAVNQNIAGAEGELNSGQASLSTARLNLDEAGKDLKRKKSLIDNGAISQAEYDAASNNFQRLEYTVSSLESSLKSAESRLAALRNQQNSLSDQLRQMEVTAPIDGKILSLPFKTGQVVATGTIVATAGASGNLEVSTDILSDDMVEVKPGQVVDISFAGLKGRTLTGRVKEIYPQAHEKISALGVAERRVTVIAALQENGPLQPGYEVRVSIRTAARDNVLVLPREAVVTGPAGEDTVRVVSSSNRVETRRVTTGLKNSLLIEITDGLLEGEQVLREGSAHLQDGTRVRIAN